MLYSLIFSFACPNIRGRREKLFLRHFMEVVEKKNVRMRKGHSLSLTPFSCFASNSLIFDVNLSVFSFFFFSSFMSFATNLKFRRKFLIHKGHEKASTKTFQSFCVSISWHGSRGKILNFYLQNCLHSKYFIFMCV